MPEVFNPFRGFKKDETCEEVAEKNCKPCLPHCNRRG